MEPLARFFEEAGCRQVRTVIRERKRLLPGLARHGQRGNGAGGGAHR